jgi:hypothetical protein
MRFSTLNVFAMAVIVCYEPVPSENGYQRGSRFRENNSYPAIFVLASGCMTE